MENARIQTGENGNSGQRSAKVFSNWLIMDRIARDVPSNEMRCALLRLRRTCTDWNRSLVPLLKPKHSPIQLRSKLDSSPEGGGRRSGSDVMKNFVRLMQSESSQHIPFTRFFIQPGGDRDEWRTAFNEFLDLFGGSITFFSLRWWKPYLSPSEFQRLIFNRLPNLSTICFDDCEYTPGPGGGRGEFSPAVLSSKIQNLRRIKLITRFSPPTFWMGHLVSEIVESSEGLDYISAKLGPRYNGTGFTEGILGLLNQPRMKSQLGKLKTLKIFIHARRVQLLQLAQLGRTGLCLEVLSLSLVVNRGTSLTERSEVTSLFDEFLLSQALTLKKLSLDFTRIIHERVKVNGQNVAAGSWDKYELPFRVPAMDRLEILKLKRGVLMRVDLEFDGSTTLTEIFPRLSRLIYHHNEYVWLEKKERTVNLLRDLGRISHPGLTDLSLWTMSKNFDEFKSSNFPGVTQLQVKVTAGSVGTAAAAKTSCMEIISRVLTGWPEVTKLHLQIQFETTMKEGPLELDLDQLVTEVEQKLAKAAALAGRLLGERERDRQLQVRVQPAVTLADVGRLTIEIGCCYY